MWLTEAQTTPDSGSGPRNQHLTWDTEELAGSQGGGDGTTNAYQSCSTEAARRPKNSTKAERERNKSRNTRV